MLPIDDEPNPPLDRPRLWSCPTARSDSVRQLQRGSIPCAVALANDESATTILARASPAGHAYDSTVSLSFRRNRQATLRSPCLRFSSERSFQRPNGLVLFGFARGSAFPPKRCLCSQLRFFHRYSSDGELPCRRHVSGTFPLFVPSCTTCHLEGSTTTAYCRLHSILMTVVSLAGDALHRADHFTLYMVRLRRVD